MLREINIRGFALIDNLTLSFDAGFSVLTGETGAGKSIIIDALGLLLGARASAEMIRTGCDCACVEGCFDVPVGARSLLDNWGFLDGDEVIIARDIHYNGRNKCRINGRMATLAQLSEIGEYLVDVLGQNDQHRLIEHDRQLAFLDEFSGETHNQLVQQVHNLYREYHKVQQAKKRLLQDERDRNRQMDLLRFQVTEIEDASLRVGEIAELTNERRRLSNQEKIRNSLETVYAQFQDPSGHQLAIIQQIGVASKELESVVRYDSALAPLAKVVQDAFIQLEEVSRDLRYYIEDFGFGDPDRLAIIEERLALINELRRKYGETEEEILAFGLDAQNELAVLENNDTQVRHLEQREQGLFSEWKQVADALQRSRREHGSRLEQALDEELKDLNMENTRFRVNFITREDTPNEIGYESIEFLISPNRGEEFKPLAKIASGGELSRLMLALKTVLLGSDRVETVVFDEIDAGIGGRTAQKIAAKLRNLGRDYQVLCVTHLPMIASFGRHHYYIEKTSDTDRTVVNVEKLAESGRVTEIIRMLGGHNSEEITSEHAKQLLKKGSAI